MAGFSFNLKMDYAEAPLAKAMIEQVLRWNQIDPDQTAALISDQVLQMVRDGSTERDFVKWCRSSAAPSKVVGLEKNWTSLLFSSVALATYSHHHYLESVKVSAFLPYWAISSMTERCSLHSSLDGFPAKSDDPVWRDVHPPNGWLCGCLVSPLDARDAAREPGLNREISPHVRSACRGWLTTRPDHILRLL